MATYKVVVYNASTGAPLAELPAQGLTFTRVLSGCGQLSFSLAIDDPAATEANLGQHRNVSDSDREICVFRDNVPVWSGPITGTGASMSSRVITVTAREASWYLGKRVIEETQTLGGSDVLDGARTLITYAKNKTATGADGMTLGDDILADIPRFNVSSNTAGVNLPAGSTFGGTDRHTVAEAFDLLSVDPQTGFEYRMDYTTGSTRQAVVRTVALGYPSLGSTLTTVLTEHNLLDFSRTCDWERAGTRVHVVYGAGVVTLQSATAVSNGNILTEVIDDLTDTTNADFALARARDLRRLSRPAVRIFTATYIPSTSLPYGFCDLGDMVPFEISWPPILSINADTRRVVEIGVSAQDGQETVTLTFNDLLSDLGA